MRRIREPRWLTLEHVIAIHAQQLAQHGGLPGVRDAGALASAVGRARHQWAYRTANDLCACAAAYCFAIAKNHAFADGNKRTAWLAMYTFLGLNGVEIVAFEPDAVLTMLAVANGSMKEPALAEWLRVNTKRRARRR